MAEHHFTQCELDSSVYYKGLSGHEFFILLLYVDEMLVAGTSPQIVSKLKKELASQFSMKDLGATKKIFWMTITRETKNSASFVTKSIH